MLTSRFRTDVPAMGRAGSFDRGGRLHVPLANISKAAVNTYRGSEITRCHELGLDPDEVYYFLRDPDELARAAHSFRGLPLLSRHVDGSGADTKSIIGAVGTDACFKFPYLVGSLCIWTRDGIDAVESGRRELSAGYHYRADLTPGLWRGQHFDGVMRDIEGEHVALVDAGRAGPEMAIAA